jgi:hypothetical protein
MLLDRCSIPLPAQSPAAQPAAAAQPFGSPIPHSPLSQDIFSESPEDSTTPSNNTLSIGGTPAAPSKQRSTPSSATSRIYNSGTVRSLTPIFNGCAAAASRAQQLGGRYARYRPQAQAISKMQRQMSGGSSQERGVGASAGVGIATVPLSVTKKRVREEQSPRAAPTTAAAPLPFRINKISNNPLSGMAAAMSIQTVSKGPEVRRAWNGNRGGLINQQLQQKKQNE